MDKIIYFIISVVISGFYRGVCLRRGLPVYDGPFNIDVMAIVVLVSFFVSFNVVHFLVRDVICNR